MNYNRIQFDFEMADGEFTREAWKALVAEVEALVKARMEKVLGDYVMQTIDPWTREEEWRAKFAEADTPAAKEAKPLPEAVVARLQSDEAEILAAREAKPEAKPQAKPGKLTQRLVKDYLRLLGGTVRRDSYGDLRLKFKSPKGPHFDEEYFAQDLEDVIGTARLMKGGHANAEQADEFLYNLGWFETAAKEGK
jgi:hypothetical protein